MYCKWCVSCCSKNEDVSFGSCHKNVCESARVTSVGGIPIFMLFIKFIS